jgi:hypothetical protein
MSKIRLLGFAFVAVSAFSVFFVASASAVLTWEPALWLNNGAEIANGTVLPVTTTGGLILKNVLNGAEILCEGIFDGTIVNNAGPPAQGLGEITKVLTLTGVEVAQLDEAGATGGMVCTNIKTCSNGAEVWPGGLPWDNDLVQDGTLFGVEALSKITYFILCLVPIIGTVEELCEGEIGTVGEILNVAGGVEPTGALSLLGPCGANAEDGEVIADAGGLTALTVGGPLSASLVNNE